MGIPFHVPITDQDTHASHRTGAPKAQRDCADETRLGCRTPKRAVYRRRRSERTLLYCTVQHHLATWLALHDDGTGCCVPGVTEREFRRHLECGILDSVLAATTSWSCIPAKDVASVRPALPAVWSKLPLISPFTSLRACRYGKGCSRCPSGCVTTVRRRGGGCLPPPLSMRFNMIMITRWLSQKHCIGVQACRSPTTIQLRTNFRWKNALAR
jgi:hypothetical protein